MYMYIPLKPRLSLSRSLDTVLKGGWDPCSSTTVVVQQLRKYSIDSSDGLFRYFQLVLFPDSSGNLLFWWLVIV